MVSPDIKVDLSRVEPFFRKVRNPQGVQTAVRAGGLYFMGKVKPYPGVRRRRVDTKRWTKKQLGYFFYALKARLIQVPYARGSSPGSERLAQRWSLELRGNTAIIGNNASYAKVMYEPRVQSWYHKGNWDTTEDMVKKHGPETARIVRVAYVAYLKR